MFMCNNCCTNFHFGGSYGPCEGCGKTANCDDCHCEQPRPIPKAKRIENEIDQEILGIAKNVQKKITSRYMTQIEQVRLVYNALLAVKEAEHKQGERAVRTLREIQGERQ